MLIINIFLSLKEIPAWDSDFNVSYFFLVKQAELSTFILHYRLQLKHG